MNNRTNIYVLAAVILVLAGFLAMRGVSHQTAPGLPTPSDLLLRSVRIFPADNPWNQDISAKAIDPRSQAILTRIGMDKPLHPDFGTVYHGAPNGIPYVVISGPQPPLPVTFKYQSESDRGPYPIPPDAPIEGGPAGDGDRHVIVVDVSQKKLYELFSAFPDVESHAWSASSGAIFDLTSNSLRPAGWTSADAAGLPIFPGLARFDEVAIQKAVHHAFRFTIVKSRRAYVPPARHFASDSDDHALPPMGMRVRLKASFDVSGFGPEARVILQALKTYGMILADNGGDWFVSGAPDPRWDDDDLYSLKQVKVSEFEVVELGPVTTR
jgi:hypothetical protein